MLPWQRAKSYIFNNEHILLITILTMKILFTINSVKKKTIPSRHYLQFLSFKKKTVLIRKNLTFHLIKVIPFVLFFSVILM